MITIDMLHLPPHHRSPFKKKRSENPTVFSAFTAPSFLCGASGIQPVYSAFPAQHHPENGTDDRLQNLIRQLEKSVLGRTVDKRSAERIPDDHDHRAEGDSDPRRQHRMLFQNVMRKHGNHDRLQTVCDKGHEHRRRVKEQIAEESADAAYRKRGERIEQNGGGAYNDIIHIEMSAGDGDSEGTHGYVESRKHSGGAQPYCRSSFCIFQHFHFLLAPARALPPLRQFSLPD